MSFDGLTTTGADGDRAVIRLDAIATEKLTSLALPRLATGVGGLERKEVQLLIDKHLGDALIPVFVYSTYQPNVKAREVG